jgi:hypothetical protein
MTIFYKDQPPWKPIRHDERFQALLRRACACRLIDAKPDQLPPRRSLEALGKVLAATAAHVLERRGVQIQVSTAVRASW